MEETILHSVDDDPSVSTRQVTATLNVDHMTGECYTRTCYIHTIYYLSQATQCMAFS
jgi:hypothetical protein